MQRSDHRETDEHVLLGRLNTGWLMCDREPNPDRKHHLEDYWIQLLREYERACDEARPGKKPDDRFSRNGRLT